MELDEVDALARSFPGVGEGTIGHNNWRSWTVGGQSFAWERSYSKADIKRFGGQPYPQEPVVAVRMPGLAEKEALLASSSDAVFTIEHFNGYAAVLVEVAAVTEAEMRDVLLEGWLSRAPQALIDEYDARD